MPKTSTEPRPPVEHERPAFGSVWTWGPGDNRYLVLGLGEPGWAGMVRLHAIGLHEHAPRVHDAMTWGYVDGSGLHVTPGWYCVQEASARHD